MVKMGILYAVDGCDRITSTGGFWEAFAADNTLSTGSVVGRSLWDFIDGAEVRHVYEMLLRRVRNQKTQIAFPFRCDAPEVRREMTMVMRPLPAEAVEFSSSVDATLPREAIDWVGAGGMRDNAWVRICSWCSRVRLEHAWVTIEAAVEQRRLLSSGRGVPQLTHTICEMCAGRLEISTVRGNHPA